LVTIGPETSEIRRRKKSMIETSAVKYNGRRPASWRAAIIKSWVSYNYSIFWSNRGVSRNHDTPRITAYDHRSQHLDLLCADCSSALELAFQPVRCQHSFTLQASHTSTHAIITCTVFTKFMTHWPMVGGLLYLEQQRSLTRNKEGIPPCPLSDVLSINSFSFSLVFFNIS